MCVVDKQGGQHNDVVGHLCSYVYMRVCARVHEYVLQESSNMTSLGNSGQAYIHVWVHVCMVRYTYIYGYMYVCMVR